MKLARREKIFVYIAATVICFFIIAELLIAPFFEKRKRMEKEIKNVENQIQELSELGRKYRDINRLSGNIDRKSVV